LKKAAGEAPEQAIGFIAFSRLAVFFIPARSLGHKISGLDTMSAESGFLIRARICYLWQNIENKRFFLSP
jgi:hypothetical protein